MAGPAAGWLPLLVVLVLACGGEGNVSDQNLARAHALHAEHRTEKLLWNENSPDAPVVTGKTINLAREMAMAQAQEDAAAAAAKRAADEAKRAAIRKEIVDKITAPFKDHHPLFYIVVGFGTVGLVTLAFWAAERYWLQTSLNLQSFWDEEITKRMYPLF